MIISHHLALAADEVFEGSVELDETISADGVKADVVAARQEKWLSLAF